MKEQPIILRAPEVRSIIAGTKTQLRRIVKPQPAWEYGALECGLYHPTVIDHHGREEPGQVEFGAFSPDGVWGVRCSYGRPGDKLWVREGWAYGVHALASERDEDGPFVYAAGGTTQGRLCERWRPSIHMPRWASRITLEITDVRVQRLQDISEEDCVAEGVRPYVPYPGRWLSDHRPGLNYPSATAAFRCLWESINGPGSWDANPFVWAITFRRLGVEGKE